jgi:hypothetical protein
MLDWGLANLALRAGEEARARQQVEALLERVERTDERTWQGLAWETRARVELRGGNLSRAVESITRALKVTEGFETPLADWRIHATAALAYEAAGRSSEAKQHAQLGRAAQARLAASVTVRSLGVSLPTHA